MGGEIELVSDGTDLAVIGSSSDVERFLLHSGLDKLGAVSGIGAPTPPFIEKCMQPYQRGTATCSISGAGTGF